ncbi:MAG: Ig-like domain-containing protein [Eubacterium sp.]|nr:Ig-like domain-containing protein [Eubacterium sp.]
MIRKYRKIALWLIICMVIGLLPGMGKTVAGSKLKVKLVLTDTFVTGKTYDLKQGKHRQLHVRIQNAKGKAALKYKSKDPSIASVTKKGYIEAKTLGTTKITVKVSMNNGKKTYNKKVWVNIHVIEPDPVVPTSGPTDPTVSMTPMPSATSDTVFPAGSLKAFLQINGSAEATFEMSILDSAAGRKFYSSLPKVLYMTDQNRVSKVASDPELIYDMEEYKPGTLTAGDFMLYGTNKYEMVYSDHKNGYAYTRIGKVLNAARMSAIIGTGAVSVSIVKGSLPTTGPSSSPRVTSSPAPWGTGTPWPWASRTPTGSAVSAAPGTVTAAPGTITAAPVTSPSTSTSPAPTTVPVPYSGEVFRVYVDNNDFPFVVEKSSSAAVEFYNSIGSGTKVLEFRSHSSENRYYCTLPSGETYTERNVTTPPSSWPAGSLVLMGNNEITVFLTTTPNNLSRPSTILGRLDSASIPEGGSASGMMRTYFHGDTVTAQISH